MSRKAIALRISEELWRDLQTWAESELRSINGQIEYLLREAVQQRRRRQRGEVRHGAKAPDTGS